MSELELNQTYSEQLKLNSRGYRLVRKLGEGSYAKVYLTLFHPYESNQSDRKLNLACKIIDTSKAPRDFIRKFLPRELNILIKLNHPHIIHVHSIFHRRSKYYIFMRFAENGDLLDFILKNGTVTENQARVWLRQISLALQYLHSIEIAHRDLKCENILITANYNIKLADFGFARYVVDSKGRKMLSETYCGSLSYAAPEILRGSPYNPKISDLWSLGVVLYIMFNKAMPFDDSNLKRLYDQQVNRKWKFRSKLASNISEQAKSLVVLLLEPEVTRRATIAHILNSDWMAMDSRFLVMSATEQLDVEEFKEKAIAKIVQKTTDGKANSSSAKEDAHQHRTSPERDKTYSNNSKEEVGVLNAANTATRSTGSHIDV